MILYLILLLIGILMIKIMLWSLASLDSKSVVMTLCFVMYLSQVYV